MSLIQEALKRQQEDSGAVEPDAGTPNPPAEEAEKPAPAKAKMQVAPASQSVSEPVSPAPELPDEQASEPVPPSPAPPRRTILAVVGVVAVIVLLLALSLWGLVSVYQNWKQGKADVETVAGPPAERQPESPAQQGSGPVSGSVAPKAPAEVSLGTTASDNPPVSTGAASVVTAPAVQVEPAAPAGVAPAASSAEPEPAAETVSVETPAPAPVSKTPPAPVAEPVVKKPVAWPRLTLNAAVSKGVRGAVMMNGKIISLNQEIEGVKVVSVGDDGVRLEFQGEFQMLRVGQSTK